MMTSYKVLDEGLEENSARNQMNNSLFSQKLVRLWRKNRFVLRCKAIPSTLFIEVPGGVNSTGRPVSPHKRPHPDGV